MKSTTMTVLLLIAITAAEVEAQSGSNASTRRSTPITQGVTASKASSQSAGSARKSGSTMGAGSTRSQAGAKNMDNQSTGSGSGQGSKAKGKLVNQRAAGVPPHTGSTGSSSSKPAGNQ